MLSRVRLVRAIGIAVVALLAGAAQASAQRTLERSGFFIGLGPGYGSLDITCDGCELDRQSGLSGYLKLGGAVSRQVVLGVESNGWYKSEEGASITFGTLTGMVYVYPASSANFYLRGGVGLATFDIEDLDTETGLGWSFGLEGTTSRSARRPPWRRSPTGRSATSTRPP
ncbi:MAG: hypothetical protein ACREOF_00455 [Gemmatimonadales bacterium]